MRLERETRTREGKISSEVARCSTRGAASRNGEMGLWGVDALGCIGVAGEEISWSRPSTLDIYWVRPFARYSYAMPFDRFASALPHVS